MKKLTLKTEAFRYLEKSYGEWLDVLGYAPSTVRSFPVHIREFLHYMEKEGHTQIKQINIPLIRKHYRELSQRSNQKRGGGLSNNYLNVHLNALDRLLEYLRKQARMELPQTGIPKEVPNPEEVRPLTMEQVKQLYAAVERLAEAEEQTNNARYNPHAQALRDKAMLAVFYDCGLRRAEGEQLNVSDIHYDNRLLEIRKGKGGKPRFVPLSKTTLYRLQDYQYEGRPMLLKTATEEAYFLNLAGTRASGNLFDKRLKLLQQHSEDTVLQQKRVYLHLLRHSIATHLLYQGMSLEKVSQFLGHHTLDSTQIYTHLVERSLVEV